MTKQLKIIASLCCQGRLISVLEGGYGSATREDEALDVTALVTCAYHHTLALSGSSSNEAKDRSLSDSTPKPHQNTRTEQRRSRRKCYGKDRGIIQALSVNAKDTAKSSTKVKANPVCVHRRLSLRSHANDTPRSIRRRISRSGLSCE